MALRWNVTDIEDFETLCYEEVEDGFRLNPITQALIHLTMAVGLGSITTENASEFYGRAALYEKTHGTMLNDYDEETDTVTPRPLTPQDVQSHVGLSANVKAESRDAWVQRMFSGSRGWIADYTKEYAATVTPRTTEEVFANDPNGLLD